MDTQHQPELKIINGKVLLANKSGIETKQSIFLGGYKVRGHWRIARGETQPAPSFKANRRGAENH